MSNMWSFNHFSCHKVAHVQKKIIRKCNFAGKPGNVHVIIIVSDFFSMLMFHCEYSITHTSVFSFLKVIITNQVLHSMITNPRPTRYFITEYVDERSTKKNKVGNHSFDFICRAECTDIVNAIFDGADCFCLTNTTAEGSSNWYLEVEVEKNKVPLIYCHRTSFLTRNFFLGTYPVKTVKMLLKQCRETEKAIPYRDVYIQNHKKKQISLHFSYRI